MRYRGLVAVITAAAVIVTATSVFALDGTRKGFVIGIGVGPGMTSYTIGNSDRESKFALASDFKIGAGISEKLLVYYVSRVSWFSHDLPTETVTAANGIGLVGSSYYFKTDVPSFYVLGSVGLSSWSYPFESTSDTWTGLGVSVGAGYEFAKHYAAEATVNWGNPGSDNVDVDALSFMVTVGVLAY